MRTVRVCIASLAALCTLAATACSRPAPAPEPSAEPTGYVIGLGEIMGLNQMRHAKLWFAGQAGNWPLAAYETDELREGFDDAVHFHPRHKGVQRPLTELVPEYVARPLADLDAAVAKRDKDAFTAAFDSLTAGCNGCHREAGFGFNVVQRPTTPPYSNQSFAPLAATPTKP